MKQEKNALVIVMSDINRDPRVRRQVGWLVEEGWTVDTIGLGGAIDAVRDHFPLAPEASWTTTKWATALIYGFFTHRAKFRVLTKNRIPAAVQDKVRTGEYQFILFNDRHFVPWVTDDRVFGKLLSATQVHLDLHEYFVPEIERITLWQRVSASYYAWARSLFAHERFTSRSTVNEGIAQLYETELSLPAFSIIRNSPPFADLEPVLPARDKIRIIHHGIASWDRGLREIVDSMRLLDDRFVVTFMLLGSEQVISDLSAYAEPHGDRIRIVPPAPMEELSSTVNQYDLEIMFYRPTTKNLELALPNKFFEAIQGRLGVVVGESPMMAKIVREYENGIVVRGWQASDLANALNSLTQQDVLDFKNASHAAADDLNAEAERTTFLGVVESAGKSSSTDY
jgi:glycosyltransferase involved in cell wall biosynthesis